MKRIRLAACDVLQIVDGMTIHCTVAPVSGVYEIEGPVTRDQLYINNERLKHGNEYHDDPNHDQEAGAG